MNLISNTEATKKIIVDHKLLGPSKPYLYAGRQEKDKNEENQKKLDIDFGENSKVSRN